MRNCIMIMARETKIAFKLGVFGWFLKCIRIFGYETVCLIVVDLTPIIIAWCPSGNAAVSVLTRREFKLKFLDHKPDLLQKRFHLPL